MALQSLSPDLIFTPRPTTAGEVKPACPTDLAVAPLPLLAVLPVSPPFPHSEAQTNQLYPTLGLGCLLHLRFAGLALAEAL